MGAPKHITKRLKLIVNQSAGKIENPEETEMIPEHIIKGSGVIYCLLTDNRTFVKVCRGITVYVIQEKYGINEHNLVYTQYGEIILIDPREMEEIGFG